MRHVMLLPFGSTESYQLRSLKPPMAKYSGYVISIHLLWIPETTPLSGLPPTLAIWKSAFPIHGLT
jgi:hypothetical protein